MFYIRFDRIDQHSHSCQLCWPRMQTDWPRETGRERERTSYIIAAKRDHHWIGSRLLLYYHAYGHTGCAEKTAAPNSIPCQRNSFEIKMKRISPKCFENICDNCLFCLSVCLSVCMSVCVCVWAMLPDSNKMMMMMMITNARLHFIWIGLAVKYFFQLSSTSLYAKTTSFKGRIVRDSVASWKCDGEKFPNYENVLWPAYIHCTWFYRHISAFRPFPLMFK